MEISNSTSLVIANDQLTASNLDGCSSVVTPTLGHEITDKSIRVAKGLARQLPPTLAAFGVEKHGNKAPLNLFVSVKPEKAPTTIVGTSKKHAKIANRLGAKHDGHILSSLALRRYIIKSLKDILSICSKFEKKRDTSVDTFASLISSMETEGGCLWKVQEEIRQIKSNVMQNHNHLQAQIICMQKRQEQIHSRLDDLHGKTYEDRANNLNSIALEMRSTTNKLNAIAKTYSTGLGEMDSQRAIAYVVGSAPQNVQNNVADFCMYLSASMKYHFALEHYLLLRLDTTMLHLNTIQMAT
ncbi:hypothetical protein L7F22_030232, partial [Adiantum nelumboides]|nr:hypothetical protein [Adiantum nelumboides]